MVNAIITALLFTFSNFSFQFNFPFLVFIAFVPLFVFLLKQPKKVFLVFFCSGFVYYFIHVSWLKIISLWSNTFLGYSAWLLFSVYLALFWAVFGILAYLIIYKLKYFENKKILQLIILAALWVFLFWLRESLGLYSLSVGKIALCFANLPWLLQITAIFGTFGVEFFVIFFNLLVALFVVEVIEKRLSLKFLLSIFIVFIIYIGINLLLYQQVLNKDFITANKKLKIGLVQPNISQEEKLDYRFFQGIENRLISLSKKFKAQDVDYILWPETAIPKILLEDPFFIKRVMDTLPTSLILGAPHYNAERKLLNVIAHIDKQKGVQDVVAKYHIVPFGEFLPLRKYLGFVAKGGGLTQDYYSGLRGQNLVLPEGKISTLICFESLFASDVRAKIKNGAQGIILITNDAWFKKTMGVYQHSKFLVLRAIETRKYSLQLGNTGESFLVHPSGRILTKLSPFLAQTSVVNLYLNDSQTFYSKYGEFPLIILILGMIISSVLIYRKTA